jgi:hypothetical protein
MDTIVVSTDGLLCLQGVRVKTSILKMPIACVQGGIYLIGGLF